MFVSGNLVVTGRIGRRKRAKKKSETDVLLYLANMCASWKDNVSPTQLISASEERVLWHYMVADVVHDGTTPQERKPTQLWPCYAAFF